MGFFSGIKKFVKKIGHGISKAFKAVRKAFTKVLSNKFVRFAMIAVSIFTMGGALVAGFANGGILGALNAAGNLVVGKVTSLVTTPLKFVAKMASGSGIGGLAEFGQALGETVGNFQEGADSLFTFGETVSDLTETVSGAAGLTPDGSDALIDVAGDPVTGDMEFADTYLTDSAAEQGPIASMLPDFRPVGSPTPQPYDSVPGMGAEEGTGGANASWQDSDMESVHTMEAAATTGINAPTTEDRGFLREAVGKIPGADAVLGGVDYLVKGFDKQTDFVKMGLMSAAQSAFAEDPIDPGKSAREEFLFRNNMALDNPIGPTVGGVRSNTALRDRNKETRSRAKASRQDIRRNERRARRDTVGSAAGFGAEPMVYTPIFSKGRA